MLKTLPSGFLNQATLSPFIVQIPVYWSANGYFSNMTPAASDRCFVSGTLDVSPPRTVYWAGENPDA
jgi:hypothetical protein